MSSFEIDVADWAEYWAPRGAPARAPLPFADGSFDAVTGFNSLQFADEPVAVLREWRRVAPVVVAITRSWDVSVPFEAGRERLVAASLWDARGYGLDPAPAREAILSSAEPFRRADGSYRLENTFTVTLVA